MRGDTRARRADPETRRAALAMRRAKASAGESQGRGASDGVEARLRIALDREVVHLDLVAGVIRETAPADIESLVRREPTGVFARRLWFLYEWLTGRTLDVPEAAGRLRFVPILDPARQVALKVGVPSGRHRVVDNLPGTPRFCPVIRWTTGLRVASAKQWHLQIRRIIASVGPQDRSVVASRLQRREAECSFALTGGKRSDPPIRRWADALGEAGARTLTLDELVRLQRIVCGRVGSGSLGLRSGGSASPSNGDPQFGGHAGARAEDLGSLVGGLIAFAERALSGAVDPVIVAAALAFGFWQIRPFIAANGHLHRWLVHYTFDAAGYTPPGFVLPISAAIGRRRNEYRRLAECPSGETVDAFRFVQMTRPAEFLYSCLGECVEQDLRDSVRE